jgi:hypothetical protein
VSGPRQCGAGKLVLEAHNPGAYNTLESGPSGSVQAIALCAKYKRSKLALYALGSAAFVALGLFLVVVVGRDERYGGHYIAMAAGILAIAFFGLCLAAPIVKWFDRRDILVIDEHGIRDLRLGRSTILWEDIRSISEFAVSRQRFFALDVDDPARYVDRPLRRFMLPLNRAAGFSALNISAHGLDMSAAELRRALGDRFDLKKAR